jgi:hypothetical protein
MTKYPIKVEPLQPYYGDDPKRRREFEEDFRTAERIGAYINKHYADAIAKGYTPGMVTFGDIANALGLKERKVQSYLHGYLGASDNAIELEAS